MQNQNIGDSCRWIVLSVLKVINSSSLIGVPVLKSLVFKYLVFLVCHTSMSR